MKFSDFKITRWPTLGYDIDFTLAKNWIPMLKLLKFVGDAPVDIKTTKGTSGLAKYEYKVRWFSPGIFTLVIWCGIRLLLSFSMYNPHLWRYLQYVSPTAFVNSTSMSKTEQLIQPMRFYYVPIINWVEWASLLLSIRDFVQFVNNWHKFENIETWNTKQVTATGCWGYIVVGILAVLAFGNVPIRMAFDGFNLTIFLALLAQAVALTEDLKILAMLSSVSTALKKIRFRVQEATQRTEDKVLRRGLLHRLQGSHILLKEQIRLIGSSQGIHEIAYLCYLVMVVTINIFLTISPVFRGETPDKVGLVFNLIHLMIGLSRLYVKCHYAECITKEETLLVDALFSRQLWDVPEGKAFADSIAWNPMKVVYGSVITMDKKLLISIAGQILTYIIILLQFQLSFGTN